MSWKHIFAGAAALLLAACGEPPPPPPADNPLLWEIADADGKVEGWLYGTIHALPEGVEWRTATVDHVIGMADYLVVEVADLEDREGLAQAFTRAGHSAGHPPLEDRVAPSDRTALAELVADTPYDAEDYRRIETWAAALILAQATKSGAEAKNGVDRGLIRAFGSRRVEQLEGAERQFAIFDGLAEADQRAMLGAVVRDAGQPDRAGRAVDLWISGDEDALVEETTSGILADPEVREALLVKRNLDWEAQLQALLGAPERPLVAVGAAHLVGPDGLVALLRNKGYTVRRVR